MNNYKCIQCGLVNWTSQEFCKRCQLPNPYLNQPMQTVGYSPNQPQGNSLGQPMSPVGTMSNYSVPPSPTVFGEAAGMPNRPSASQYSPTPVGNHPKDRFKFAPAYSPEEIEQINVAEKQIRNAWICGVIVCAISLLVAILFAAIAKSDVELPASPFEIFIAVILYSGLTIGVYFKSRACAILLCGLFILDKIIAIATSGKLTGAYLAFILIYYFIYGIQGTFTYQRLKKDLI